MKLSEDSRRHLEVLDTKLKKFISSATQWQQSQGNSAPTEIPAQNPMVSKKGHTTITTTNNRNWTIKKKSMESNKNPPSTTTISPASSSRLTITPLVQISSASPSASQLLATNKKVHHLISTNSLLIDEDMPLSTLEESVPTDSLFFYRN